MSNTSDEQSASVVLEIGPDVSRLLLDGTVHVAESRLRRGALSPELKHSAWLFAHLRSRINRSVSDTFFSETAAEMDGVLMSLGRHLAIEYLPDVVVEALSTVIAQAHAAGLRIRVGLRLLVPDTWDLDLDPASLPWESTRLGPDASPLALIPGVDFVRLVSTDNPAFYPETAHLGPVFVVAAFANPTDTAGALLPMDAEADLIQRALSLPDAGLSAELMTIEATDDAILLAAQWDRCDILHLSAHGDTGRMEVQSPLGYASSLSAECLGEAIKRSTNPPRLLFLNACMSGSSVPGSGTSIASYAAASGVSAAIGMRSPVSDLFARLFAGCFYTQLVETDPSSLIATFCDARRRSASVARELLGDGEPLLPVEWATPIMVVREDVVFTNDERVLDAGSTERRAQERRRVVFRAHLQGQIRQAVVYPSLPHRLVYGSPGCGKSTEVLAALKSCEHLIAHLVRLEGNASEDDFREAVVAALLMPSSRLGSEQAHLAGALAERIDAASASVGKVIGWVGDYLDRLPPGNEWRVVIFWDRFETNLSRRSGTRPLGVPYCLDVGWAKELWGDANKKESGVRVIIASRHLFTEDSGTDELPESLIALNVGLMSRLQSDDMIDRLTRGAAGADLKSDVWRRLGGHPGGIETVLNLIAAPEPLDIPAALNETVGRLQSHCDTPAVVSGLSEYARELAIRSCIFRIPVPTGSLLWMMLAIGLEGDDAVSKRVEQMAYEIGETPIAPHFDSSEFYEWDKSPLFAESDRDAIESHLRLDPWLRLSRRGQIAAINELMGAGVLCVDTSLPSDEVMLVIAPRFVAEYFSDKWPDETRRAHVGATRYWLSSELSGDDARKPPSRS